MRLEQPDNSRECRVTESVLAAYMDNTLSARDVWEVEKHFARCPSCAATARQMQSTVDLLRAAPRLDTGDDFMAKLHARLDDLEPKRPTVWSTINGWMGAAAAAVNARRMPAVGLGLASAALAAVLIWSRPAPPPAQ